MEAQPQIKKAKRVLMFAWEYPPRIIGGLSRVVQAVSQELVRQGHEVHVVTADHPGEPEHGIDEGGVHVHRVKNQTDRTGAEWKPNSFLLWDARLNIGTLQHALKLHREKPFDIVHVHDWLDFDAGWVMQELGVPMIATIHATEFGRNGRHIVSDDSRYIDEVEWRLAHQAGRVIVNSGHMAREVISHFDAPADKVVVIPNGINPDKLKCDVPVEVLRQKHGVGDGPVILFVGRLVQEKGVQFLLQATPTILKSHPDATVIVAGTGYFEGDLKAQAASLGISHRVKFFGMANDRDLSELYAIANVLVVPSTYEPFGIVPIEGMAAGAPVVVADNGGLLDIVEHMKNGLTTYTGDAASVAWGVLQVLDNPELAERLKLAARQTVLDKFTWPAIVERTLAAYETVLALHQGT